MATVWTTTPLGQNPVGVLCIQTTPRLNIRFIVGADIKSDAGKVDVLQFLESNVENRGLRCIVAVGEPDVEYREAILTFEGVARAPGLESGVLDLGAIVDVDATRVRKFPLPKAQPSGGE